MESRVVKFYIMLQSKLFYKTTKPAKSIKSNGLVNGEKPQEIHSISHDLLTRAGYIDQLMAGVYSFLPLGHLVLRKIENIIRKEMKNIGSQEILMPVLQPKENWIKTNRWESLEILFRVKGIADKEYALGPTHEEVVVPLAKRFVFSYRDLPFSVFQIQTKFRDELRVKSGVLRTKEFLMKDLYSFHANQKDLDQYYEKTVKSYKKIFDECGIGKMTYRTLASGGSFSKYSDEFQTITNAGEDVIYICKKCSLAINKEIKSENLACPECKERGFEEKKSIEVGNIFKLGTNFSKPFDLRFTDRDGEDKLVLMGCYGIGLPRLMGAVVEVNYDNKGIIWPESVAPFLVHLIQVEKLPKVKKAAEKIYIDLRRQNIEVLYDDRQDKSVGEKFAEADLIGLPYRVVVSGKTLAKNSAEVKKRAEDKFQLVKISNLRELLD